MLKKFWVNMDGVLGTAHTSRTGEVVGFVPAQVEFKFGTRPTFRLTPKDGWTAVMSLPALMGEVVSKGFTQDGQGEIRETRFWVEHLGVLLEDCYETTELTDDARESLLETQRARSSYRHGHRDEHLYELMAWIDQRLFDPLSAGLTHREVGRLLRKPTRAREAVPKLVEGWLLKVPLSEGNQFAKLGDVMWFLNGEGSSDRWLVGVQKVQASVLEAEKNCQLAKKADWLATAAMSRSWDLVLKDTLKS